MSVEFQCSCGKRLRLSGKAMGGQGRCPACGTILELPTAEPSAPPDGMLSLPADTSTALTAAPSGLRADHRALIETPSEPELGEFAYGQPDEHVALPPPTYGLASPGQIGVTGFLGGPLGGFLLMARNYAKLGRPAACWITVAVSVTVTVVLVGISFTIPDTNRSTNLCIGVPLWIGTYLTARILQERTFQAHRERGGAQSSGWAVLWFTLLGIVLTIGCALGAGALYEVVFADRLLKVTDVEEIYYSRNVTEAEALTLARVLQQQGIFDGVGEKGVRLHKDSQGYVLIVFLRSGFNDPQVHQVYLVLAGEVSGAFGNQPVRIDLCDEREAVKKSLQAEHKP